MRKQPKERQPDERDDANFCNAGGIRNARNVRDTLDERTDRCAGTGLPGGGNCGRVDDPRDAWIGTGEHASGGRYGETGDGANVAGTQSCAAEGNGGYANGPIAGKAQS